MNLGISFDPRARLSVVGAEDGGGRNNLTMGLAADEAVDVTSNYPGESRHEDGREEGKRVGELEDQFDEDDENQTDCSSDGGGETTAETLFLSYALCGCSIGQ